MFVMLKNFYIQRLHTMRQMKNHNEKPNVIFINQQNKFKNYVTVVIIHEHQNSISIWSRWYIKIIYEVLQIFQNNFIKCEVSF